MSIKQIKGGFRIQNVGFHYAKYLLFETGEYFKRFICTRTPQGTANYNQTAGRGVFCVGKITTRNTAVPPKGKTSEGLKYSINQEKYLKVFLTDGNVPIDHSASERAICTFCIAKKN